MVVRGTFSISKKCQRNYVVSFLFAFLKHTKYIKLNWICGNKQLCTQATKIFFFCLLCGVMMWCVGGWVKIKRLFQPALPVVNHEITVWRKDLFCVRALFSMPCIGKSCQMNGVPQNKLNPYVHDAKREVREEIRFNKLAQKCFCWTRCYVHKKWSSVILHVFFLPWMQKVVWEGSSTPIKAFWKKNYTLFNATLIF
jgi:hypothetical protein